MLVVDIDAKTNLPFQSSNLATHLQQLQLGVTIRLSLTVKAVTIQLGRLIVVLELLGSHARRFGLQSLRVAGSSLVLAILSSPLLDRQWGHSVLLSDFVLTAFCRFDTSLEIPVERSALRLIRLTECGSKLTIVEAVPSEYSVKFHIDSKFLHEKSVLIFSSMISVESEKIGESSVLIKAKFNTVYDTKRKQILPSEQLDFLTTAFTDSWPCYRFLSQGTQAATWIDSLNRNVLGITEGHPEVRMLLQVHDEIIFDCPEDYPFPLQELCTIMEDCGTYFGIPCKAKPEIIKTNWAEGTKCFPAPLSV